MLRKLPNECTFPAFHLGFNPCCNGKCSGSITPSTIPRWNSSVSILVVMESAQEARPGAFRKERNPRFNPCCNGKCSGSGPLVSPLACFPCFNPCCNGKCSGSVALVGNFSQMQRFNPCCNGKCSGSGIKAMEMREKKRFQSLL